MCCTHRLRKARWPQGLPQNIWEKEGEGGGGLWQSFTCSFKSIKKRKENIRTRYQCSTSIAACFTQVFYGLLYKSLSVV